MTNTDGHDFEKLPLVLLHGTSGKSGDWSQVVERLASHRSVIRPNYGEPVAGTDSANAPRVSDFADRVVAAAGAGGSHRFDLVGYSLGAAVATYIAAEYPEMVRSLVLVSGFSYGGDPRMRLQFDLWLHLARDGQDCPCKTPPRERPQPRISLGVRREYHRRMIELCGDERLASDRAEYQG